MSRVLKFRIWSYEDKYYRTDCNLTQVFNSMTGMPATVYSTEGDRFDIEQYTGLKDKNGIEIYEGDIVRYSFTNPNRTYTEPVSFGPIQDGEGYCHQEFLAWRTTYVDDGEAHSSLLDLVEPNWTCEIIGNIHENPELLGEKE